MKKLIFILLLFITACASPQKPSTVDTIISSRLDSSYTVRYSDFVISEYWIKNYKITIAEDGIYPLQFIEGRYEILIENGLKVEKEKSREINTFTTDELDKLILYLKSNKK